VGTSPAHPQRTQFLVIIHSFTFKAHFALRLACLPQRA
jgi:hypothetical protein